MAMLITSHFYLRTNVIKVVQFDILVELHFNCFSAHPCLMYSLNQCKYNWHDLSKVCDGGEMVKEMSWAYKQGFHQFSVLKLLVICTDKNPIELELISFRLTRHPALGDYRVDFVKTMAAKQV